MAGVHAPATFGFLRRERDRDVRAGSAYAGWTVPQPVRHLALLLALAAASACGSSGSSGTGSGAAGAAGAGVGGGSNDAGADASGGSAGMGGTAGSAGSSGSAGSAGSSGTGGAAGAGGTDAGPPPDPCSTATPSCPAVPSSTKKGKGLIPIDRCAFPLDRTKQWTSFAPLVDALRKKLPSAGLSGVLGDLNRSVVVTSSVPGGPAGVVFAFHWDSSEYTKAWWIPQGITGSADADASGQVFGRRVVVVSFYYDSAKDPGTTGEKGIRVAFVDVTNEKAPKYRFALLVEPTGTTSAPDFAPVNIHAGGIAWVGDHLYVADTFNGFRVFDTRRIYRVATGQSSIGCSSGTCYAGLYKYILPEVGSYSRSTKCSPRFSFVSAVRDASGTGLVSGEYCSGTSCTAALAGRLFRWPLDPATDLPAAARIWPSHAWFAAERQLQGAAESGSSMYMSSSEPAGAAGALFKDTTSSHKSFTWIDSPEDLMIDPAENRLWSLSEAAGARYVFAAKLSSY